MAPGIAFEVGFYVTPRLDIVAGVDVSGASTVSEYRDFVDNNRLPITQKTELRGTTITGSLKYALDAARPGGRERSPGCPIPSCPTLGPVAALIGSD